MLFSPGPVIRVAPTVVMTANGGSLILQLLHNKGHEGKRPAGGARGRGKLKWKIEETKFIMAPGWLS